MYYALKPEFQLRGWKDAPCAVVQKGVTQPLFLTEEGFEVACSCNGKRDLDKENFTQIQRDTLKYYDDNGFVTKNRKPLEINKDQEYYKYPARYMKSLQWSITGKCNYKCKHCYICGGENKLGELSFDKIDYIIDEIAKCGIREVAVTGGEPLIRKDFWQIIDRLLEEDIIVSQIYSNGYLITEEFLDKLEKRNLYNVMLCISYDGKGFHDWLRGVPGAEEMASKAIERSSKRGFRVGCEMCLHDNNIDDLRENINHLAKIGCQSLKAGVIDNSGAWKENGYGTGISFDTLYQKIVEYIPKYYEDGAPLDINLVGIFAGYKGQTRYGIPLSREADDPEKVCLCKHVSQDVYISPEGRVLPCFLFAGMEIQNQYKSVLENSLTECLEDPKYLELT